MSNLNNEKFFLNHGINSILLVPLLGWFIFSLIIVLKSPENYLPILFFSPVNVVFGVLFFSLITYHLNYEMMYLINIHIKNKFKNNVVSFLINLLSTITIITVVLGILQLHFSSILIL